VSVAVFSFLLFAVSSFLLWGALSIDHAMSRGRGVRVVIRTVGFGDYIRSLEERHTLMLRELERGGEGEEWKDA
jgi:hypothetical protein